MHTRQLQQFWEEVESRAVASHQDVQGSFVLGCHSSVGLRYLAKFLPDLLSNHPNWKCACSMIFPQNYGRRD